MMSFTYRMNSNDITQVASANINLFANDTSSFVIAKSPSSLSARLQEIIYSLAQWFNRWLLSVNVQKSAVVAFRSTRMKAFDLSVSLDGMSIPQVSAHKHLGVTFSDTLTWENHIDAILSKGAQRIGLLRRYRKRLPSLVIRHFYCTSICPALEYASVAWSGLPSIYANLLTLVLDHRISHRVREGLF